MNPTASSSTAAAQGLLLAADVGGSHTRVVIAPAATSPEALPAPVLGPGANIRSSGPEALDALVATVREALAAHPADRVHRAVLAISGAGPARHAVIHREVAARLGELGICSAQVVDDLAAAFLAGGAGRDGILLLAGTGAVAARVEDGRTHERIDGMGWLLGDVGSAVWIGRRVLEAVAADIDGRGRRTSLTEHLGDVLDLELRDGIDCPTGDARQDLISALDSLRPADWGRFAPLPALCLPDPVAREILDGAARALMRHVRRLDPDALLPVVLAGSVLTGEGPIHQELISCLQGEGRDVSLASSGIAGAWRLAQEASALPPAGGPS